MPFSNYVLHYAPDNASLIVRLALEEIGAAYGTQLVNRREIAQRSSAYLKLNPNGLIPVLETSDGPIFETGAILLWLADRHTGLAPSPSDSERANFLKWLFYLSNTLHPALRMLFYTPQYIGADQTMKSQLRICTQNNVREHLQLIDQHWSCSTVPLALSLYLCPMLRWLALYPANADKSWFSLSHYPRLHVIASACESRPSVAKAIAAEGLGPTPFTAPRAPNPPEGSAT